MGANFTEEPWEREISSALGQLGLVEPPPGAIELALDHRPKHAGRVMALLATLSIVAVVLALGTGAVTQTTVTPNVDELAEKHQAVEAGVLPGIGDFGRSNPAKTPVEMPEGFERTADVVSDDVLQAVYGRGDESVSVFVQPGRVKWASLSPEGRTEINGTDVWMDDSQQVAVIQTSDGVVSIVGLSAEEVELVLKSSEQSQITTASRIQDLVAELAGQLGFPNLE